MTLGMIWTIILRFAIQDISVEGACVQEFQNKFDSLSIGITAKQRNEWFSEIWLRRPTSFLAFQTLRHFYSDFSLDLINKDPLLLIILDSLVQ